MKNEFSKIKSYVMLSLIPLLFIKAIELIIMIYPRTTLSVRHKLLRDAVGTVVDVEFHPAEFHDPRADWRASREHPAWERGYVYLNNMPRSVHVRFDGCLV